MGDIQSLIGILVVGVIVGWLASVLVQGKGMGLLPNMVVGVLGAIVGTAIVRFLHLRIWDGILGTLAVSLAGAVVLLVLIRLIKSPK